MVITFLYSIHPSVFLTAARCVPCEVQTELYIEARRTWIPFSPQM